MKLPELGSGSTNLHEDSKKINAMVMKYYVLFCLFLFLGTMMNLPWLKYAVGEKFRDGLGDGTSGAWTSLMADWLSASILEGRVGAKPRSVWKSRKCMSGLALRDIATYSLSSGLRGMHDVSALEYARNGAVWACGGPTVRVYAECERLSA